jgi:hypothetical protein
MKRSLIVTIVISGTVAVCGICGLGLFTGFGNPERQYRAELANGVAVGLPENPEDYQIQTPDSENAAPEYRAAIAAWDRLKTTDSKLQRRLKDGRTSPTFSVAQAEKDLAQIQPILAALDRAIKYPRCNFGKQYAKGMEELFPELSTLRDFARLRTLRAGIYAQQGDFGLAWAELYRGAVILRQLATDNPSLIPTLAQISIRSTLIREAERIFTLQGRNSQAPARAERLLELMGPEPQLKPTIRGEYALTLAMLSQLSRPSSVRSENSSEGPDRPLGDLPDRILAVPSVKYQLSAQVVKRLRGVYEQLPANSRQSGDVLAATKRYDDALHQHRGVLDRVSTLLLPELARAGGAIVRSQVESDLLRILAASLAQPSGIKIPANLPLDPFSGKPFRATQNGSSIRIWSVGPDLVDDGGNPIRKKDQRTANGELKLDITVGYPYVPKSVAEQKAYGAAWLGTLRKP